MHNPTFVIVYNVMNKNKTNSTSKTIYKNAPKKVKTKNEAMMHFYNVIDGKTPHIHKRLVEIRG